MPRHARFEVFVTPRAERDLAAAVRHALEESPAGAVRMAARLARAIRGLQTMPERHGRAPEADRIGRPLRHVMARPYRVIFQVSGTPVDVLAVRHAARLPAEDL